MRRMPKRHDVPGYTVRSESPPPAYEFVLEDATERFKTLPKAERLDLCYIDEDLESLNLAKRLAEQTDMANTGDATLVSYPTLVCDSYEGEDMPDTFADKNLVSYPTLVCDSYEGEDMPDTFSHGVNTDSETSVERESVEGRRSRSPLLRQPAYDFESRRPSEVSRCMCLFKILSRDFSQDDDIEVDGDVTGGNDCVNGLDDVDGGVHGSCTDLMAFIKQSPEHVRGMIASYLSTGKVTDIVLCPENYHLFLHVSINLNLRQLKSYCIQHYFECDEPEKLVITGECSCTGEIESEAQKGYRRSESVVSEHDDLAPPEYYIAFSKSQKSQEKVKVVVINMSAKCNVLQRIIEKPFGKGFACCSVELKESPFVFVSGGENKSLTQFWKYDVIVCRWDKQPKLNHGRSCHVMAKCGNSLYVIGGKETSCIEEYNLKEKKWKVRAALATSVYSSISAVHGGKIYIFGGKTPAGPVSTVQYFDTATNAVHRLPDLPCPISNGQAVVMKDNIYIASGQGHMIVFDTLCGVSNLCSEQPIRRSNFGMFVKSDRVYFVGGELNEGEEKDSEPQYRYNPEKDCWVEKDKLNMNFPVYASCIIRYPKKCPVIPFES